jgi:hypothetical protein
MEINWTGVFNRLFKIIDRSDSECYYSGPRFIRQVQELDPDFPNYTEYIRTRQEFQESTTRRDYFKDILNSLSEPQRFQLVSNILSDVERFDQPTAAIIRSKLGGETPPPSATIPNEVWNAGRLNGFLADMDAAIADRKYERTVTLAYTCFEGFMGAFLRANIQAEKYPLEIIELSKAVKDHLRHINESCPPEVLNIVTHSAHAVDKARNRFSESHFGEEAAAWLAVYIRDLVNVQIRLMLHFM